MSVSHSHSGQKPMKRITLNASEEVEVDTYVSYWLAMIMPENAGGRAPAITSILRFSSSIWNMMPTIRSAAGIITILRRQPRIACQLIVILNAERVIPAAKTAIEAFAPLIRSNDGESHFGQGMPAITHITARIGAHATG